MLLYDYNQCSLLPTLAVLSKVIYLGMAFNRSLHWGELQNALDKMEHWEVLQNISCHVMCIVAIGEELTARNLVETDNSSKSYNVRTS